jgi:hypothetical protein
MPDILQPGYLVSMREAYVVRQGRVRTVLMVALFSILPAFAMVIGLRNWSSLYPLVLVGVVFELIALGTLEDRIRKAIRREQLFVIDARGVFLGSDEYDRPAKREPWSRIDFVVHFNGQVWTGEDPEPVRHVGVVRDGKIVNYRAISGWSLNIDRATEAAARYGQGTPLLEAPFQRTVPKEWFHTLPLPQEWLAESRATGR